MKILIMGPPTSDGYRAFGNQQNIIGGGWVENLIVQLLKKKELELFVCFYYDYINEVQIKKYKDVSYIALPARVKGLLSCNEKMRKDLKKIIKTIQPDIVHIIGTEREHNLRLLELAGSERTVISMTGLVGYCAKHYYGGIEKCEFHRTIGDILRKGGPIKEKKRFERFGEFEKKTIQMGKYIMGRTTWDFACAKQINPNIEYIYCSEILNPIFQIERWNIKNAKQHRIFVSQASYPLKGLHNLLKGFPIVLKKYPDAQIVIAGIDIMKTSGLMDRIKRTTYANYLIRLIKEMKIPKEKIKYLGALNAEEMCKEYLKANVFILPSAIENSPNSLGEAMLLGVPCIASCVGGVQDMLEHKEEGFIYPFDESYMLAHYICEIFGNDKLATDLGNNARKRATVRFDENKVVDTTIMTYKYILEQKRS